MSKIGHVFIEIRKPRDGDQGRTEEAFFVVNDGVVMLVTQAGEPTYDPQGKKITAPIKQGETASRVAARLLRASLGGRSRAYESFSRNIRYPKSGVA